MYDTCDNFPILHCEMSCAGGWMGPEAAVTRPEQIAPQHGVPTLLVLGYRF